MFIFPWRSCNFYCFRYPSQSIVEQICSRLPCFHYIQHQVLSPQYFIDSNSYLSCGFRCFKHWLLLHLIIAIVVQLCWNIVLKDPSLLSLFTGPYTELAITSLVKASRDVTEKTLWATLIPSHSSFYFSLVHSSRMDILVVFLYPICWYNIP